MSTISQVSKNLKKKLSFEDYAPQVNKNQKDSESKGNVADNCQQDSLLVSQLNSKMANQSTDVPSEQYYDGKMVKQQDSIPVKHLTGKTAEQRNSLPVSQHVVSPSKRYTSKTASHSTSKSSNTEKIKATYYLTAQEHQALMEIYIQRLQGNKKTDKSALIGEAIQLLYEKENK
jgi:hypothetical protein